MHAINPKIKIYCEVFSNWTTSLHQSHGRVCAGIINWSCLLASAGLPGSWRPGGSKHEPVAQLGVKFSSLLMACHRFGIFMDY